MNLMQVVVKADDVSTRLPSNAIGLKIQRTNNDDGCLRFCTSRLRAGKQVQEYDVAVKRVGVPAARAYSWTARLIVIGGFLSSSSPLDHLYSSPSPHKHHQVALGQQNTTATRLSRSPFTPPTNLICKLLDPAALW